uniref:Uncharacterized protein n=1 Tax=Anguilla anguilla TaxID=7936 RepID=A0A0E9SSK5_ANGAN
MYTYFAVEPLSEVLLEQSEGSCWYGVSSIQAW